MERGFASLRQTGAYLVNAVILGVFRLGGQLGGKVYPTYPGQSLRTTYGRVALLKHDGGTHGRLPSPFVHNPVLL